MFETSNSCLKLELKEPERFDIWSELSSGLHECFEFWKLDSDTGDSGWSASSLLSVSDGWWHWKGVSALGNVNSLTFRWRCIGNKYQTSICSQKVLYINNHLFTQFRIKNLHIAKGHYTLCGLCFSLWLKKTMSENDSEGCFMVATLCFSSCKVIPMTCQCNEAACINRNKNNCL